MPCLLSDPISFWNKLLFKRSTLYYLARNFLLKQLACIVKSHSLISPTHWFPPEIFLKNSVWPNVFKKMSSINKCRYKKCQPEQNYWIIQSLKFKFCHDHYDCFLKWLQLFIFSDSEELNIFCCLWFRVPIFVKW